MPDPLRSSASSAVPSVPSGPVAVEYVCHCGGRGEVDGWDDRSGSSIRRCVKCGHLWVSHPRPRAKKVDNA
jgi:hypothetical protein